MTTENKAQGQTTRSPLDDLRATLEKMGGQFKALLPSQAHVDRFIRVVMTAVQGNPDLVAADRTSFYAACMNCAKEGLMPDGKEAVLKIYNEKQGDGSYKKVAAYEPMADGLMKKLRLTGEVIGAPKVHVVYAADEFVYELGDNERIVHMPALTGRGAIVAAYSIVKLKSGDTSREVMSIEDIDAIMNRTKSKDKQGNIFGPWKTDKAEMCRKTVFKRHYKRLPRSTDLDNVINYDNEHNGVVDIEQPAGAPVPAAAPAQTSGMPARRPAALEHVVSAHVPMQTGEKREPVTVEGESRQEGGEQAKHPTDII